MMKSPAGLLVFIFLIGIAGSVFWPIAAQNGAEVVDPSQGEIDGQVALSFWPYFDSNLEKPLDPSGFEVHLTTEDRQEEELVYPCGTWFVPPPAKYKVWLEGPGWMSPASSILIFRGGPFQGRGGVSRNQVVPAGRVALSKQAQTEEKHSLRLLHLESHSAGGNLKREMSRRVVGDTMTAGVYFPEGLAIGALYDHHTGEYLALTRPFRVIRGEPTVIHPHPPSETSADLVVVLERPEFVMDERLDDVRVAVASSAGEAHSPDVVVRTTDRIYAVWYGLSESFVTLEIESRSVHLAPRDIVLRPGRVENHRDRLQRLPNLDVELLLPPDPQQQSLTLSVFRGIDWQKLSEIELGAETTSFRVESLPTEPLWISLRRSPWVFYEKIDLSDGDDSLVVFRPEAIEISGTVYYGDSGHPGRIRFRTHPRDPEDELEIKTDEKGHYQASLFRAGYYVTFVELEGIDGPPFLEYTPEPIREDRTLDFHVPANAFRVRVLDDKTGDGIAEARVVADNEFKDNRGASHESLTDADGVALLAPLRPGIVKLTAKASGYHTSRDVTHTIGEDEAGREILVRLEPVAKSRQALQIFLPNGQAADHAEVRLHNTLGEHWPIWEGQADKNGRIEVPESIGRFLLSRHFRAGSALRPWPPPGAGRAELAWQLPPLGEPLDIKVVRGSGEPAMAARIGIWVDNQRLSGNVLAWFAGARAGGTNAQGFWRAERLPDEPLRIMSWLPEADARALSGVMDSLSEALHPPRPNPIELTAFD